MSTSLPKLQILLNDMLVNARAKRTQQNLNFSFGEKDYITICVIIKKIPRVLQKMFQVSVCMCCM